jgi:hypothetical protein
MGGSAGALKKLRKRIVDLQPIVRECVYHREFGGSFSLKAVLPALVPGLGYDDPNLMVLVRLPPLMSRVDLKL